MNPQEKLWIGAVFALCITSLFDGSILGGAGGVLSLLRSPELPTHSRLICSPAARGPFQKPESL